MAVGAGHQVKSRPAMGTLATSGALLAVAALWVLPTASNATPQAQGCLEVVVAAVGRTCGTGMMWALGS